MFRTNGCANCHGYSGQGGYSGQEGPGPRVARTSLTFERFREVVTKGRRNMPPFDGHLTDTDLTAIFAFLKGIPPSPDPSALRLLDDGR